MAILPDFALVIVRAYLQPLRTWFSEQIYAELLKRAEDHFLLELLDEIPNGVAFVVGPRPRSQAS